MKYRVWRIETYYTEIETDEPLKRNEVISWAERFGRWEKEPENNYDMREIE